MSFPKETIGFYRPNTQQQKIKINSYCVCNVAEERAELVPEYLPFTDRCIKRICAVLHDFGQTGWAMSRNPNKNDSTSAVFGL